jgi:membrane complex biogenesis BtpA family protein
MLRLRPSGDHKVIIGMVHLPPLPGTPFYREGSLRETIEVAVMSARRLEAGGADGCLVQTVDRVYPVADEADPARTAALTLIVNAIVEETGKSFDVGLQVMRNGTRVSLGIGSVTGASFIRCGALVGATLSAQGIVNPEPFAVMEYRAKVAAQGIAIIADVDSMHFSWLDGARSPGRVARDAAFAGADAVAVGHPDEQRTLRSLAIVRDEAPEVPLLLAGHTDHSNVARLLRNADGVFVGGCIERGGLGGEIDVEKLNSYVGLIRDGA